MNVTTNNINNNYNEEVMNMGFAQNENGKVGRTGFDIMRINFKELTPEERKMIREQSMDVDITEIQAKLETIDKKYEQQFKDYNKKLKETDEKANKTAEQINVIGFGIHSKKGKLLRQACAGRVYSILGDKQDFNFLLWSSYFFKKIHSDLSDHFEVDSFKNIHVDHYEQAKAFASSWRPDDKYVIEKTQELIEKRNNGFLKPTRSMALAAYLMATDNGTYNPF